jgi:hypothetical protein
VDNNKNWEWGSSSEETPEDLENFFEEVNEEDLQKLQVLDAVRSSETKVFPRTLEEQPLVKAAKQILPTLTKRDLEKLFNYISAVGHNLWLSPDDILITNKHGYVPTRFTADGEQKLIKALVPAPELQGALAVVIQKNLQSEQFWLATFSTPGIVYEILMQAEVHNEENRM